MHRYQLWGKDGETCLSVCYLRKSPVFNLCCLLYDQVKTVTEVTVFRLNKCIKSVWQPGCPGFSGRVPPMLLTLMSVVCVEVYIRGLWKAFLVGLQPPYSCPYSHRRPTVRLSV